MRVSTRAMRSRCCSWLAVLIGRLGTHGVGLEGHDVVKPHCRFTSATTNSIRQRRKQHGSEHAISGFGPRVQALNHILALSTV